VVIHIVVRFSLRAKNEQLMKWEYHAVAGESWPDMAAA